MRIWVGLFGAAACNAGGDFQKRCGEVPEDRVPPAGYAELCETDEDCVDGMVCKEGAAGGYYYFYEYTCTPTCATDADCPVVQGECSEEPYCSVVDCDEEGYCSESTCV